MHPITGGSVILGVTPVGTSSSFIQSGSIYIVVAALVLAAFIATATPAGAIAAVAKEVLKDIVETALKHWIATTVALGGVIEWVLSLFPPADQIAAVELASMTLAWEAFMMWYAKRTDVPILQDAVGLGLTLVGTLIVFKILPLANLIGSQVLAAVVGTALSAGGFLLALHGKDAPGPIGLVEEFLEAAALGFDIAKTLVVTDDCVSGNGC